MIDKKEKTFIIDEELVKEIIELFKQFVAHVSDAWKNTCGNETDFFREDSGWLVECTRPTIGDRANTAVAHNQPPVCTLQ